MADVKNTRPPYLDHTLPISERVDDLISRMTLEEKVSQMVNDAPAIERLGIPAYNWWNECLHGVARAGVATVFPQAIGLAATFDTDLMSRVASAISDEARAKHRRWLQLGERQIYTGLTFWSPNVNVFRDPRWGRGHETYGEDPYLTSRMGVAFVKGLQGNDPKYLKLVATPKHYAVHSGPEPERHSFDAIASERDMRETYLPAFEACVREGGAQSIMGAYNRTNGEPCCASPTLLQKTLRDQWGFEGYVVSDCGAINDIYQGHRVVETPAEAAALAVNNGCDLECGCVYQALTEAVEKGLIEEKAIDRALRRLFTARFRLGMFDPPEVVPYTQIPFAANDSPEHRALALQASRESIVLLKNEGNVLPLRRDLESIAVIGPNADDLSALVGNYNGTPAHAVTPLEGIRKKLLPSTKLYYAQGCEIAVGVPPLSPVSSAYLHPLEADAGQHGLTAEYFDRPSLEGTPVETRVDSLVDFAWKGRSDDFAIRWSGFLVPPVSGAYRLGVYGFTHYKLFLNGEPIVTFAGVHHGLTRYKDVPLEAGRYYRLRLDYTNDGIDPQVQLLWSMPGMDYSGQAAEVAKKADVVVMCLGLNPNLEGEEMPLQVEGFRGGDRTEISLPRPQEALLQRIYTLGKPVVLVLLNGSALAVHWADASIPAIVEAWYPGQAGGDAIADVLFGDYNPGGRLPVTFYRSVDQLPPFTDYDMVGRTYRYLAERPLYPFGHGLSYTRFAYANLRIAPEQVDADGQVAVSAEVTNAGDRVGDEVVQLYVSYPDSRVSRPIKDLKGFQRVRLQPGETKTVSFDLPMRQLAYWDQGQWVVEPGTVQVLIGSSSEDIRLRGRIQVTG